MKLRNYTIKMMFAFAALLATTACQDKLDVLPENTTFTQQTDYTNTSNMDLPLKGVYATFNDIAWENFPLISVRGDDVNSGGGSGGTYDQNDYHETDLYNYNKDYWMYNSVWQNYYGYIFTRDWAF